MTTDNRTARHTLRTVLQVLLAVAAGIPTAAATFGISTDVAAKMAAVIGLLVVGFTAAQNALEQSGTIPVLLPNPNAAPATGDNDGGWGLVELLAVVAVVLIVLLLLGYLH